MRRRLMRLKRLRDNPLAPLVCVGLMGIGAFILFVYNLFTHGF